MKRQISAGFFLTALSAIAGIAALAAYLVNCGTAYFSNLGISPVVAGCTGVAVVLELVLILAGLRDQKNWMDILPVASSVLLIVATISLISARANGIAAIISFENNAQNMADLSSAIVGIAACLVAALISIVSSFFDISK